MILEVMKLRTHGHVVAGSNRLRGPMVIALHNTAEPELIKCVARGAHEFPTATQDPSATGWNENLERNKTERQKQRVE
jgi:hypothetical protein